jgi:IS30 family transposase
MAHEQLSQAERYAIGRLKGQGMSLRAIGRRLDRAASTIWREVQRNSCARDGYYRPDKAHARALNRRWSTRKKSQYSAQQWEEVEAGLRQDWSPKQVVAVMWLQGSIPMSYQTVYRRIHHDRRRGGRLWSHMRHMGKYGRKRRGSPATRGRLAGKSHISQRPQCVEDRREVGHCEVDTVMGREQAGPCVLTLVERSTGYLVMQLLQARTKEHAGDGLARAIIKLDGVVKTITADNGTEFHGYKAVEDQFGVKFFFATPYHSWERGTNENTNGLIRQYLPKGTSMRHLRQTDCDCIATKLNNRPRERLGFKPPAQMLVRLAGVAIQV